MRPSTLDRYKEEKRLDEDDDDEPDAESVSDDSDAPPGPEPSGRVPRVHRPPVRYNPGGVNYLSDMDDLHELIESRLRRSIHLLQRLQDDRALS